MTDEKSRRVMLKIADLLGPFRQMTATRSFWRACSALIFSLPEHNLYPLITPPGQDVGNQ
jgi:hypothetical protein